MSQNLAEPAIDRRSWEGTPLARQRVVAVALAARPTERLPLRQQRLQPGNSTGRDGD